MPSIGRLLFMLWHPSVLRARLDVRRQARETDRLHRRWRRNYRGRLEKFRNIHRGEQCFIIGNGPSLNKMDLGRLNEHTCFGLNKIHLICDSAGLEVDYHVAVNPLVIQQSAAQFARLRCPSFLSYQASIGHVKPVENIVFLLCVDPFTFRPDITQGVCDGYTVTYAAMQIAYFMGFKEVYLIGVDHNFDVNGKPNELQYMSGPDPNHFDPGYFRGHYWHLPDLEGSELAYRMAQFFFRRDGREIYDATVDGKLNVFPKISYDQALANCKDDSKIRRQ